MSQELEELRAEIEELKVANSQLKTEMAISFALVSRICLKIPTISFALTQNDPDLAEKRIDEFMTLIRNFDTRMEEYFMDSDGPMNE